MEEYTPEDYKFPIAYVEGLESEEYLVPDLDRGKYRIVKAPVEGGLGKAVYERVPELAVDLEAAKTRRGVAVRVPWKGDRAMYLASGSPIHIYEVGGVQTIFYSHEGDDLEEGDVLAYVLTGKGETRTIRVDRKGTVFYIGWLPGSHPPRYIVILAGEENLIILDPEQ